MSDIPARRFKDVPPDIKANASLLVDGYGHDAALLEGAIVAALLSEREHGRDLGVVAERERCAKLADRLAAAVAADVPVDGYFADMQRTIIKGMDRTRMKVATEIAAAIRKGAL